MTRRFLFLLLPLALVLPPCAAGCAPKRPGIVEAGGVVLLDGQPLPFAYVEFIPILEHFGAEMSSTATTDEAGRFTLKCNWMEQEGATVARHRVVVREGTVLRNLRGQDAESQNQLAKHLAALRNRPIPEKYGTMSSTPVEVEVKAGEKEYKIDLKRE